MPMLKWLPKDRASAQQMLDHPWLAMPDDYEYRMTDLEQKKYKLRQTFEGINEDFLNGERAGAKQSKRQAEYQEFSPGARIFDGNVSDLADEDSDINGGDHEDNVSTSSVGGRDSDTSSDECNRSRSLGSDKGRSNGDDEFNLNVSFTGGYVPNTDLKRVDKGQGNP